MSVLGLLVFAFGLTLRAFVSRHSHSGQSNPPMFGDFEAQRHWQEITVNLPANQWYFNTTDNDLNYWGLDYPPLTAYHSFLIGKVAEKINSSYIALGSSRGLEDDLHKMFMRATVLASDILIYGPSAMTFGWAAHRGDETKSLTTSVLMLTYPGLILIDHGHFQYNGVSLGLMVFAVACLIRDKDCLGSILFIMALSYKQMELYHALPFFFYLLGKCFFNQPTWPSSFVKLFWIGATVVGSFIIIWLPFLSSVEQFLQVIHRVFPLARGVFEDKVANVWCAINVVVKIKELYEVQTLAVACLASTFLASFPSNFFLFLQPTKPNFVLALINTSLAFFLFSFQVHEKSILLVAIPVAMFLGGFPDCHRRYTPLVCVWFLTVTTASMFPLLQKDMLAIPTLALSAFFLILSHFQELFEPVRHAQQTPAQKGARPSPKPLDKNQVSTITDWVVWTLFNLSVVGFVVLSVASVHVDPPAKYPHLWQLLISLFSVAHFVGFAVYFNVLQFDVYRNAKKDSAVGQSKKRQ